MVELWTMNLSPSNNFPSSVPPHFLEKKCGGLFNTVEFGAVVSDSWLGSSQTGWAMPVLPHFLFIYLFIIFTLSPAMCSWESKYSKEGDKKEGTWSCLKLAENYCYILTFNCLYFLFTLCFINKLSASSEA